MKRIFFFYILLYSHFSYGQVLDWVSLNQTVNKRAATLVVYNNELIAAGTFSIAGTNNLNKIARWNGSIWSALGTGIRGGGSSSIVLESIVYNNELLVAGNFDSAGTVACKDIAKWNGTNWSGFGTGSNADISSLAFYNGELYAGGTFTNIGGVPAKHIAKWNGSNWQALGVGLTAYNVNDLCVYQNELYAVGNIDSIGNIPCNNIARWNGVNWNTVSVGVPYGNVALHVWQNKLIIGANSSSITPFPTQIWQWDGSTISIFSQQQNMLGGRTFLTYNSKLYSGGISFGPVGKSTVYCWNPTTSIWDTVGTKINNVNTLCEFNSELYCAGDFKIATGVQADYIAKLAVTTGIKNNLDKIENIKLYPNPFNNKLKLDFANNISEHTSVSIFNSLGQIVHFDADLNLEEEIDLSFLASGIYYLKVQNNSEQKVFKIIKQ